MAGEKTGADYTSFFAGENMLGVGALRPGVVACKIFEGGYRWVSAVFVEVREIYACADYIRCEYGGR